MRVSELQSGKVKTYGCDQLLDSQINSARRRSSLPILLIEKMPQSRKPTTPKIAISSESAILRIMLLQAEKKIAKEIMTEIDFFSPGFFWDKSFIPHRFQKISGHLAPELSILEAIVRSDLTNEERLTIFPAILDLGRRERLAEGERTYQSIADVVAEQLRLNSAGLDSEFVKTTAEAIMEIVGFPYSEYRNSDPDTAARVLKLLVFLKKRRRSTVMRMIKLPGNDQEPSLELTNPYPSGALLERRQLFSDMKAYLSTNIPLARLKQIDDCFGEIWPQGKIFLNTLIKNIRETPLGSGPQLPSDSDQARRLNSAAKFLDTHWTQAYSKQPKAFLPLDQQLYVHLSSLEHCHRAEFERTLANRRLVRVGVRPVTDEFAMVNLSATWKDLQEDPSSLMQLRPLVATAFGQEIPPEEFTKTLKITIAVLRRYMVGHGKRDIPANKFVLTACLCFAADLHEGRVEPFKPYIIGQGNISGSVKGAILSSTKDTYEEYEHFCIHTVTAYIHALIGTEYYSTEITNLRKVFYQAVNLVCRSHCTEQIENFLQSMRDLTSKTMWWQH